MAEQPEVLPAPDVDAHGRGDSLRAALAGAGRIGRDLLAVDWDATPLGAPQTWSHSLASAVRILVSSRFSMWLAWGPQLTFFCNDAYRRDTLGTKYPWALGRPADQVWAEIWPDIGPRIERVTSTGTATWDEALLLFLERSGYLEETYHTFSYSPLTDDDGSVAGMLCVVSEDTERVIGERRMRTLRDLGSTVAGVRSEADLMAAAHRALAGNLACLPFTLTYLFGPDGAARLAGTSGIDPGHPAAPAVIEPAATGPGWPAAGPLAGRTVVVDDLLERFGALPTGAWSRPPDGAMLVPLVQQSGDTPYGFLVAAVNRYRPLDEDYRGFVELVAGQLAAAIASSRVYQAERHRAEALAELDRAKTAFFTNVSHEFRTPLTLMLGPAEDALDDTSEPLAGGQRQRIELMHRNAQRLLKLVNTLLDFSRLEQGGVEPELEPVDLARYTAELAETFRTAAVRAGLTLTVNCPPLDRPVRIDREMWAKIVLNLLSNALKFTFEGGITVTLAVGPDCVRLTVADTGIGVDPVEQPRLFDRFHRVPGVRSRSHEGSGIGLALVAELVAMQGGTAEVDSRPGEGSSFSVNIPLVTADSTTQPPGIASVPEADPAREAEGFVAEALRWLDVDGTDPAADVPNPDDATLDELDVATLDELDVATLDGQAADPGTGELLPAVLIVDDNADLREYLTRLLADRYRVRTASDGVQALRSARSQPPDLVLTDVMMPELDGVGLLRELRADPVTALIPVVLLSARAGPEAAVEGLDAGADDYLVKPFSARELLARVRANLELDRTRRAGEELRRSRALLDQAQRLARVGSWEIELSSGSVTASEEFSRQVGFGVEQLQDGGFERCLAQAVHPDDVPRLRAGLCAAASGELLDLEVRLVREAGTPGRYRLIGVLERGPDGAPARLRGSSQDVTEQRRAEKALAAAAAAREAAAREHRIADELQRSLLPDRPTGPDHLRIATYYRAGVEGTQVGGDWFDVIELGADRTALVIGDVMGRGVRAAAVMGQLRAAVRAFARLDLPPADLLEYLDALVRDLGDDQIVTCLYAVYDPGEGTLAYANAGHLPPLLAGPGPTVRRLTGAAGPPLGSGPLALTEEHVPFRPGSTLTLYTDGLVEHRDRDIDTGIDALADRLTGQARAVDGPIDELPADLVATLVPDQPDDDIAVLIARLTELPRPGDRITRLVPSRQSAVRDARSYTLARLAPWRLPPRVCDDVVLLVSELVTNAVVHGRAPIELRLRHTGTHVLIEVCDGATFLPRKLRPTADDEHGRGLQLVARMAERWGTRPTLDGKSVWCLVGTGQPIDGGRSVGAVRRIGSGQTAG